MSTTSPSAAPPDRVEPGRRPAQPGPAPCSTRKRGELRQRYREGQEDQLGALGLVVNITRVWNTLYMTAAVERLKQHGYPVLEEDLARLSPLI
ncbi:Tn3 family transposase [Pseudomonas aeruginosa]|nr:Tn3 family transposase [Pseudomonas aeruginosa]